jgi:YD repeat-containing protein
MRLGRRCGATRFLCRTGALRRGTRPARLAIGVIGFLLVVSAVLPVSLAASQGEQSAEGADPTEAGGPAAQIQETESDEANRQESLNTPQRAAQRENSTAAFANLGETASSDLLINKFGSQLQTMTSDPGQPLLDADRVLGYRGDDVALIDPAGSGTHAMVVSSYPLRTPDGSIPDLTLQRDGGQVDPVAPVSPVTIPNRLSDGATLDTSDVGVGVDGARSSDPHSKLISTDGDSSGKEAAFYPDVVKDTDVAMTPVTNGLETLFQIRSQESPEDLTLHLDLPQGARLVSGTQGTARVVDKSGKVIAAMAPPSVTDAQGTSVPITTEVQGDSVDLHVPHQSADVAYPLLLDPYWTQPTGFDWVNESFAGWGQAGGYFYATATGIGGAGCGVWNCWGDGLYLQNYAGNFVAAGSWKEWLWTANGQTTWIPSAYYNACFAKGNDSFGTPYGFWGLYSTHVNAWDAQTSSNSNTCRAVSMTGVPGSTNTFVVGMGSTTNRTPSVNRETGLSYLALTLADAENPTLNALDLSAVPSGWLKSNTAFFIGVSASDAGLGVREIDATATTAGGNTYMQPYNPGCVGTRQYPCPASTPSGAKIGPFSTAGLHDGDNTISVQAFDALVKPSNTRTFQVHVDTLQPKIDLSGQLADATNEDGSVQQPNQDQKLSLPRYKLTVSPNDSNGSASVSGIADVSVYLDSDPQDQAIQPDAKLYQCSANCSAAPAPINWWLDLSSLSPGHHVIHVTVTDKAGNTSTRDMNLEYTPATGETDEDVVQHVHLPDGTDLGVNVSSGNLVYHAQDVQVPGENVDLSLDRYYNSQLPRSQDTEWGDGWTLSQAPQVDPYTPFENGSTRTFEGWANRDSSTTYDALFGGTTSDQTAPLFVLGGEGGTGSTDVIWRPSGSSGDAATWSNAWPGTGRWVHWALEFNEPDHLVELFINGQSMGTKTISSSYADAPGDFNLGVSRGGGGASDQFDGKLDDAAIYDYALGPSAIAEHYGKGLYERQVKADSPSLYWRLGEASGSTAADSSGNQRPGTFSSSLANSSSAHHIQGALPAPDDDGAVGLNGSDQYVSSSYATRRNLVLNPGVEADAGWWGAWGSPASLTRTTAQAQSGTSSLKVAGAPSTQGIFTSSSASPGKYYSAAAQLRPGGSGQLGFHLCYMNSSVQALRCDAVSVSPGASWGRAVLNGSSYGPSPAGTAYVWMLVNNEASTTQDFYLDSAQIEEGSTAGAYFDGSIAGSRWEGTPNNSTSIQDGAFQNGTTRAFEGWANRDTQNKLDFLFGGTTSDQSAPEFFVGGAGSVPARSVVFAPAGNAGNTVTWDNAWPGTSQWVHWALVFNESADTAELFINGESKGVKTLTTKWTTNPGPFLLGAWGANNGAWSVFDFDGKMDEVAVYDHALSASQIGLHYGQGLYEHTVKADNPAVYWRLGESSGASAADGSGHSRTGTYVGSPSMHFPGPLRRGDDDGAVDLNGANQYLSWAAPTSAKPRPDPVSLTGPTGDIDANVAVAPPSQSSFDGSTQADITEQGSGGFQLTYEKTPDDTTALNANGSVDKTQSITGASVNYSYTSSGDLDQVTTVDPSAPDTTSSAQVDQQDGLVSEVSAPSNQQTSYAHDAVGNLTSVDSQNDHTTYTYDAQGWMTDIHLADGTHAAVTYDSQGRVTQIRVDSPVGTTKTTTLQYSDQPHQSTVTDENGITSIYSIGSDGSVLRSTPGLQNLQLTLQGSLPGYSGETLPPGTQDLGIRATGGSISKVAIEVDGISVDEQSCDGGTPSCDSINTTANPWSVDRDSLAPGVDNFRVLAFRANGESASQFFSVYVPPPPDGLDDDEDVSSPVPPPISGAYDFRQRFGLATNPTYIDPEHPGVETMQTNPLYWAGLEDYGVPLTAAELAELQYRQDYVMAFGDLITNYAASHPYSYAGYYVDHSAGGIIHVGFTSDAQQHLDELKSQFAGLALPSPPPQTPTAAPDRLALFPSPPTATYIQLDALASQIRADTQSGSLQLGVQTTDVDAQSNTVQVGVQNLSQGVTDALQARYGAHVDAVQSDLHPDRLIAGEEIGIPDARFVENGQVLRGGLCSAGFGAKRHAFNANGQEVVHQYLLTAGHCVNDTFNGPPVKVKRNDKVIGWAHGGNFTSTPTENNYFIAPDGAAVTLDDPGRFPTHMLTRKGPKTIRGVAAYYAQDNHGVFHTLPNGTAVCNSGRTTGPTCGSIVNSNYTLVNGIPMVEADYKSQPGDSGGAVWIGGRPGAPLRHFAVGINDAHLSCSEDGRKACAIFTPLRGGFNVGDGGLEHLLNVITASGG